MLCTCSLTGLIGPARKEAVSVQPREDSSLCFFRHLTLEGPRAAQHSEVVIHSAQVGVGDLSPGKKLQSHPRQVGSSEPRKTTCFTRSKGSQQQRKGSSRKEKERQPLSPPSTLIQAGPKQSPRATGRPSDGLTEGRVHCRLKTTACPSKAMLFSIRRGMPRRGADQRALSIAEAAHRLTKAPLCL